jgi:hypothetical protein
VTGGEDGGREIRALITPTLTLPLDSGLYTRQGGGKERGGRMKNSYGRSLIASELATKSGPKSLPSGFTIVKLYPAHTGGSQLV